MMSLHKLTAGDGYTYLTRQVAAGDLSELNKQSLADYYSEKGERPGQWLGSGLTGIEGVAVGDVVTEEQMQSLFGHGRHPNAEALRTQYLHAAYRAGRTSRAEVPQVDLEAQEAGELGAPFRSGEGEVSDFVVQVSRRFNAYNASPSERSRYGATPQERGEDADLPEGKRDRRTPIPETIRHQIRTTVGRETFRELYGRDPFDDRELAGHIARQSRRGQTTVAGYDLTFSPVKSVSTLWAIAPRGVAEQIEQAHDRAVREVIGWAEHHVLYSRRGKAGVRQVDVTGAVATAFTHRDSRAGDPDLHTHVAVANKVQDPVDGKWLAIDGRTLHKLTVSMSERYNTILERELRAGLGLSFVERKDAANPTKRGIREIAGVDAELMAAFSRRRARIVQGKKELVDKFQADHGRPPTPKEAIKLAQQATLDSREGKHEPRSLAEQRTAWRQVAHRVLGGQDGLDAMLRRVRSHRTSATKTLTERQINDVAGEVLHTLQASRAQFQAPHVIAEATRRVRSRDLEPEAVDATIDRVVAAVMDSPHTVTITAPDPVEEPEQLRRKDGSSVYDVAHTRVYTTDTILGAETRILQTARRTDGRVAAPQTVTTALLEAAARGPALNPAQAQMVQEMATSGARVQLGLAPAGSGKTTTMRALAATWEADGGNVIGFAPSAVAAQALRDSMQADGVTGANAYTLATLTFALQTSGDPPLGVPADVAGVNANTLVIIDEAGMAGTIDLAMTIDYVTARGGSVRLIGDDQQLASVAAGGTLRDIAADCGAVTLSELHRFQNPDVGPAEAAATLALRDGRASEALGFYLDNDRIKVAGPDTLTDVVYAAWAADRDAGKTTLMLAYTNEAVNELNARARADRLAAASTKPKRSVALACGLEASAGDVLITRKNDRRLRITGTDFVKNGDRWILEKVARNGSIKARHQDLGRVVTLPADYVSESLDLGYASTYHGAQGQTVDTTHCLLTGTETRQLLYVGASRGRYTNTLYVPVGGDGDEHARIYPENATGATATEFLENLIRRDGAPVSAHTQLREASDPAPRLARAADRYQDALGYAATTHVGADRMRDLTEQAEQQVPGVTSAPAWDTLAGHLAILELQHADPIARLSDAATARELDTAHDLAAVLDWRLDTTGGHSCGPGPLPWIPGVPAVLADHDVFGPWLTARHTQVADTADALARQVSAWSLDQAPEWARPLTGDRELLTQVATWRAVEHVAADDPALTGRPHPSIAPRHWQKNLERRIDGVLGHQASLPVRLRDLIDAQEPRVTADPWWPILSGRLTLAGQGGLPVADHLATAFEAGPLPDDHPAAALWSRLAPRLAPAAATSATEGSGAARLRPPWTDALIEALPEGAGPHVLASTEWPALVAAVDHAAARTRTDPRQMVTRAVGLIGDDHLPRPTHESQPAAAIGLHDLAAVLTWRISDLTTEPPDHEPIFETDLHDPDKEAFAAQLAAEADQSTDHTPPPPPDPITDDPADQPEADHLGPTPTSRIIELTRAAADFYTHHYNDSPAQNYLTDRLTADPADGPWTIGYAPTGWDTLTRHLRETDEATDDELIDAGLAKYSSRGTLIDVFRDRAMLGIYDTDGTLVGFVGRDLSGDSPAKYLNTPHTALFTKGAHLFGLHEAITTDQAPGLVIVEGPLDALALSLAARDVDAERPIAAVASLTAGLTDAQADLIADHCPTRVAWQAPDRDQAGRAAQDKDYSKLIARGITPRTVSLPGGGKDAADAWHDDPDLLRTVLQLADRAPHSAQAVIDHILAGADLTHTEGWVQANKHIASRITELPPDQWEDQIGYTADQLPTDDGWHTRALNTESLYTSVLADALRPDPDTGQPTIAPDRISTILTQLGTANRAADPTAMAQHRNAALRNLLAATESLTAINTRNNPAPVATGRSSRQPERGTDRLADARHKLAQANRPARRVDPTDDGPQQDRHGPTRA